MEYTCHYDSPLGGITIASDGTALTGLWFDGQKYFAQTLDPEHENKSLPVLEETCKWLDIYFDGKAPDFLRQDHDLRRDRGPHCRRARAQRDVGPGCRRRCGA